MYRYLFHCNEDQIRRFNLHNKSYMFKARTDYTIPGSLILIDLRNLPEDVVAMIDELVEEIDTIYNLKGMYQSQLEYQHGRKYDDDEAERKLEWANASVKNLYQQNTELKMALQLINESNDEIYYYDPTDDVRQISSLSYDMPVLIDVRTLTELIKAGRLEI